MPSAKHNSAMERATGLISSLLNITSSQDMPFHQLQQLHSKHHGATFVLLCLPVLFTDNARCHFAVGLHVASFIMLSPTFCEATWIIAEKYLTLLSFVMLCNKYSIATTVHLTFQCVIDYFGFLLAFYSHFL